MTWEIITGDCLDTLRGMPDASVDAVVTDPPYGLGKEPDALAMLRDWMTTGHHEVKGRGFMGKAWDAFVPQPVLWAECLRVLKPGGHLLAFGGTRTIDLVTLGIRMAKFEIRDSLQWVHGQGFPKSRNISKDLDEAAGIDTRSPSWKPTTPDAIQWAGWQTAAKPAHEPIVVARKPLSGTVAATVLEHGTGAINVDACRVGTDDNLNGGAYANEGKDRHDGAENWRYKRDGGAGDFKQPQGRWPSNLLLSHLPECGETCAPGCAVREMGEQSGESAVSGAAKSGRPATASHNADTSTSIARVMTGNGTLHADTGTAARFFPCFRYQAKPSRAEKVAGVTPRAVSGGEATDRKDGSAGLSSPRAGAGRTGGDAPMHPTTKPIELMRWLVKLVCPPSGTVLDPFAGSGTTGCAAVLEGLDFIGCELSEEYAEIARERIEFWSHVDPNYETTPKPQPKDERQATLFGGNDG